MFRTTWVLEKIILPLSDFFNRSPFYSRLLEWRSITGQSRDKLDSIQAEKLTALLGHASKHSPFYAALNIPREQNPYLWLKSFPVVSKKTYREQVSDFLSVPKSDQLVAIYSSGSSGPPSQVFFTKQELAGNRALQVIWWEWAGYKFGNSILQTGVNMNRSSEKKIKDFLLNTRYIDAMSHSETEILKELRYLEKNPKDHFIAYASSLFLFAKTALAHGITGVKFKSIISLGEKLLPQFRETIETAFSCFVYDTYGASEGFLIASQCKSGSYHIMSPHVVVEILNEKGEEVMPGETGRVVLTGLDNFTTPLIRYEVGDLATKSIHSSCSCGLNLPLLDEIIGRQTEFILTPGGKFITVQNVVRIMKQFPGVEQFKVVQDRPEYIRVIYVPSYASIPVDESQIKKMFDEVFAEPLDLVFEQVQILPKAKTGKFQLIERNF